jgi:hypothetical protein
MIHVNHRCQCKKLLAVGFVLLLIPGPADCGLGRRRCNRLHNVGNRERTLRCRAIVGATSHILPTRIHQPDSPDTTTATL